MSETAFMNIKEHSACNCNNQHPVSQSSVSKEHVSQNASNQTADLEAVTYCIIFVVFLHICTPKQPLLVLI